MNDDLSQFSDDEILALTALGESESLGEKGMQQTINVVMNRVAANLEWMGGANVRDVCLQPEQFQCWDVPKRREYLLSIGSDAPTYAPYVVALRLAEQAISNDLRDITDFAVSYGDNGEKPPVHPGSQPCLVDGSRVFYDLSAVA